MTMQKPPLSMPRGYVVLPSESQCPKCHLWDITDERVIKAMSDAGKPLHQAACMCNVIDYEQPGIKGEQLKATNLPFKDWAHRKTFSTFNTSEGTLSAFGEAQAFGKEPSGPTLLVLIGKVGTGKSHLLEAMGCRHWEKHCKSIRYEFVPLMLEKLRAAAKDGTAMELLDVYTDTHLLLLDDLGARDDGDTEYAIERLFIIINERIRGHKLTAIATNRLDEEQMAMRVGDRIANRLWDRNTGTTSRAYLTGESYRTE